MTEIIGNGNMVYLVEERDEIFLTGVEGSCDKIWSLANSNAPLWALMTSYFCNISFSIVNN